MIARREHPLQYLQRDFDRLFGRLVSGWLAPFDEDFQTMRVWDFDVTENGKELVVRAEMPGFEENEINVQLTQDVLTIRAEKEQKGDGQDECRRFVRTVVLPSCTDADKIQATYRNGVLELHLPRAEGTQPKQIKLQGQQGTTGQQALPSATGAASGQSKNQGQEAGGQAGAAASKESRK
jgi:HSP20 family protein